MERVLHVVTYMGRGGLETMLMNYYRHIDRNKIQFDFLVHRDFEADYDEEILSLGGKIYHISKLVPWSRSYHEKFKLFLRAHPEYKIIHVHQDCLSAVALKCAAECRIPIRIAHSHSSSQTKDFKYPLKLFYKRFIPRYATHLIACSQAAGKWMFHSDDFIVMKNAIDVQKYTFNPVTRENMRNSLHIGANEIVIGHVGRFEAPKNHDFIVDIFADILKQHSAKLLLVGDGSRKKAISEKVAALGIGDKVIFTGVRSDVADLLQAMDVFIFPSLYEGLPLTLIEAQAAGLPCIISDGVPAESVLTDLVVRLPLSVGSNIWAQRIMDASHLTRKNAYQVICDHGFDIYTSAHNLEIYYEKIASGEKEVCL